MIKTCNNCDVEHCKGNYKSICGNHRSIVSTVPFRACISKVTIKDVNASAGVLVMFKPWM